MDVNTFQDTYYLNSFCCCPMFLRQILVNQIDEIQINRLSEIKKNCDIVLNKINGIKFSENNDVIHLKETIVAEITALKDFILSKDIKNS